MRKLLLAFLMAGMLFQVSCSRKEEKTEKPSAKKHVDSIPMPEDALSVNITGQYGGRVVAAILGDLKTFNQLLYHETDSNTMNQLMNPGLTALNNKTMNVEPALAKSWDISEDNLTFTFHLRKGLHWSDGHPFTAADVLFTMEIVNDPKISSGAQDVLKINGKPLQWSQVDDHTVVMKLPSIYAPILNQLDSGTVSIVAKHKWEKAYREGKFEQTMQVSMDPNDFVCLGAFKLKQYKAGQSITLTRNPYYWKKDRDGNRLPYLDEIVFLSIPSQDQTQLKILNGELDVHYSIRPEDLQNVEQKAASIGVKVYNLGPAYDFEGIILNQNGDKNPKTNKPVVDPIKRAWFTDLNFRKAIAYAIDRNTIVSNAYYGKAIPSYQFESVANHFWYNDAITKYPHDPAKALELLKASGFRQKTDSLGKLVLVDKKGNEVRFSLVTNHGNSLRAAECNIIASDLAKLGMQVQVSIMEFNMLVNRIMDTYDYEAILGGLSHDDTDPSNGMNTWLSSGTLHFWWPKQKFPHTEWEKKIDELMYAQIGTYDLAERKKFYGEVQQIVSDQQPMVFTINPYLFVCAKENIGNLSPTVARHRLLWNGDELYWKKGNTQ